MTFTKEQEAFIEQVAYKVGNAISAQIRTEREKDLQLHAATCAVKFELGKLGRRMDRTFWIVLGFAIAIGGASGGGLSELIRYLAAHHG